MDPSKLHLPGHTPGRLKLKGRRPSRSAAIVVAGFLTGCAVGPDFEHPAGPAVSGYLPEPLPAQTVAAPGIHDAQRFVVGQDIPRQRWALFHSPALNELVARALSKSPTVHAAEAALRVAQENVYAQQG